jgi:hypothetical protein
MATKNKNDNAVADSAIIMMKVVVTHFNLL